MRKIQYILIGVSAIFLLWFLAPVVTGILNIGNLTGIVVFGGILLYGIFMERCNQFLSAFWQKAVGKAVIGVAAFATIAIVMTAAAETFCMVRAALNSPPANTTVVVLGCSVKGTRPSWILESRLEAAYEYLLENEEAVAILSGGQGKGEDISEAQCMYEYLTAHGIDGDRLILEDQSTDTEENLKFSMEIMEDEQLGTEAVIITSEFHEYRAQTIAKKIGLDCYGVSGHTFLPLLPTYYVRELYAILEQWILK